VTAAAYREFMTHHAAGVCIVTTVARSGAPTGMTCSSLVSVAVDPPTLSVSLRRGSATLDAVLYRRRFAVHLLHDGGENAARRFAARYTARFAEGTWAWGPGGLPCLPDDANAVAECLVHATVEVADHVVVFGAVQNTRVLATRSPLVHTRRTFRPVAEPAVSYPID
jgi:flavin reductase (DIM6/NTAB) family NADH-FMN oxidoreductase RutF